MKQVPEIMATIGPTLEKPEDLRRAVEAGARWFRLPCGYRQRPHVENARDIRAVAAEVDVPVRLLLDLPSSRPRTGAMKDLQLEVGARILLWDSQRQAEPPVEAGAASVPLPQLHGLFDKIAPGHRIWFCDGRLEFVVEEVRDDGSARPLDPRHHSVEGLELDLPARQRQPLHDGHRGRLGAVGWFRPGGHRARLGGAVVDLHARGRRGGTREDRCIAWASGSA